jgi:hypothetical protein
MLLSSSLHQGCRIIRALFCIFNVLTIIWHREVLFWLCLFIVLNSWIYLDENFSTFGNILQLFNRMLSMPFAYTSFSSTSLTHGFGILMMYQRSCIHDSLYFSLPLFKCSSLSTLSLRLIFRLQFEPVYWWGFQLSFIWFTELSISRVSILFFSLFSFLYWTPLSYPALSSFFYLAFYLYSFLILSSNYSFKFLLWDFIHFPIIRSYYCGAIDIWRSHVSMYFSWFSISALEFVHWG